MSRPHPAIALVQAPPVFLNLEASLTRAVELVGRAAREGAAIVVFPETWLPGYPVWIDSAPGAALWDSPGARALHRLLQANAVTIDDARLAPLVEAAARHRATIVMGAHERRGGTLYNTMLFIAPDGRVLPHRKLVPTYTERLVWGMGDGSTLATLDTPAGTLGGLICWEHWMPLPRAAMHAKGEAIHVAQWPTVNEMHLVASRHYAFEGRCFVAASGCLLAQHDVIAGFRSLGENAPEAEKLLRSMADDESRLFQRGGSSIIAPDGGLLVEPVFDREAIVTAALDPDLLAEGRMTLDTAGHYSRPDVFELRVDTREKSGVRFGEGEA